MKPKLNSPSDYEILQFRLWETTKVVLSLIKVFLMGHHPTWCTRSSIQVVFIVYIIMITVQQYYLVLQYCIICRPGACVSLKKMHIQKMINSFSFFQNLFYGENWTWSLWFLFITELFSLDTSGKTTPLTIQFVRGFESRLMVLNHCGFTAIPVCLGIF